MTAPEPEYVEIKFTGNPERIEEFKRAIETGEIRLRTDDDE